MDQEDNYSTQVMILKSLNKDEKQELLNVNRTIFIW